MTVAATKPPAPLPPKPPPIKPLPDTVMVPENRDGDESRR